MAAVKRRINSTGRRRISQERVSLTLLAPQADGLPRAKAELNLEDLAFPSSSAVVLEAYQRLTASMRFDCGKVGELDVPDTLVLSDIDPSASVLFRLKVVDSEANPGLLLGAASRLRPNADDSAQARRSLFPIERRELNGEIWKVDLPDTGPVLALNYNISGLVGRIQKDPLIQGILLPAALRIVLNEIVQDPAIEDEDEGTWKDDWLRFCREELNIADDPADCGDDEDRRAWVNDGVRAFCTSYKFVQEIRKSLEEAT